jgi:hypothetical protein
MYLANYHKICNHLWRPIDTRDVALSTEFKGQNTGCLLYGRKGNGKSGVLWYASAWCHENNWVNVTVPRTEDLVNW